MPRPKVIPAGIAVTIPSSAILLRVSQAGHCGRGQRAQALTSGNLKSSWADSPEKYLHTVHRGHALTKGVRK